MLEKKLDLTISLLSSGRSSTIERCLSSLAPFKEQMDTEIIIVDTDPDHNKEVLDVLDKYADQIIPFEWCNDFSAARNVGVDAASGEWFMYIDDDEWFIDAQPLIDFLKSKESRRYNRVSYRVRNYGDDALTQYGDSWASRLFKIDGKARLASKVHEYIYPTEGVYIAIESLVGHTGYIFHSREEQYEHARRNVKLLEQMMEEEPREVRWVTQMMTESSGLEDVEKEIYYARKGISMMKGAKGYVTSAIRGLFAANLLRLYRERGDYQQCYDEYAAFIKSRTPLGRVAKAYMEFEVAQACFQLGFTKKARKHIQAYITTYNKMKDAPVEYSEDYTYILMTTFEKSKYFFLLVLLIRMDIEEGSWESFDKYYQDIDWADPASDSGGMYVIALINAAAAKTYDRHFSELVKALWAADASRTIVQQLLVSAKDIGGVMYWNLVHAIAEAGDISPNPVDIKIIWADHQGRRDKMPEYFDLIFASANPLMIDPMLWRIGLRRGAVLDEKIGRMPMERWQACVNECVDTAVVEHVKQMSEIMDDLYVGMPDERYGYWQFRASEKVQKAKEQEQAAEEERKRAEQQAAAQTEMKQIIAALEKKVDELVAGGMIEEADKLLQEIQKYTDMIN